MSTIFRPHVGDSQRSDRSARDRQRHRQKIRESIRDNIADILAEESIIGRDKDKIIKVPIRSIKEYRFIYGENAPGVAQGHGDSKPGDVVGKGDPGQPDAAGQAGDQPGVDAFETDVTLEELIEIMFEDLALPELQRKALRTIESDRATKRRGVRREGIRARLDKRRTAKNRIKRMLARSDEENEPLLDEDGQVRRFPFHRDDMRYQYVTTDTKLQSNAVVICIMDTSGSMGTVKKYLARSFYFLLYQFIRLKYQEVELVFIAHHTEAKEVSEQEFFHKVESGGTYISSGYNKALEVIEERYHPSLWNVYAFHCSDGDNFYSDNERALQAANELCDVCNLFGYGEIKPSGSAYYSGSMLDVFNAIDKANFQTIVIEKKEDLWDGFRAFMMRDTVARDAVGSDGGPSDSRAAASGGKRAKQPQRRP
ncbi:MAG: sporulation protein YhbH [Bdellovibrionales bacterium]|nr:sporulation protein YhbH [Bdellovibrionales bacterium]